jgi:chromosomal replication initiation ATPase DnaA
VGKCKEKRMPLAQLIKKVASHLDLKEESITSTSRRREISEARSIVSYLAINKMGYSASNVGWALSINRENASRGAARGKKALDKYEDFKDIGN